MTATAMLISRTRLRLVLLLCALLGFGGVLEYMVMTYVHSSRLQWTVPARLVDEEELAGLPQQQQVGWRKVNLKASLSGSQGADLYRNYLESIGREKMLALREKLMAGGSTGVEKQALGRSDSDDEKDQFYQERDYLLGKIDGSLARLEGMHWRVSARRHDDLPLDLNALNRPRDVYDPLMSNQQAQQQDPDARRRHNASAARREESDYAGSRFIDGRFRYIHNDNDYDKNKLWGYKAENSNTVTEQESPYGPEVLVENDTSLVPRQLSPHEAAGNNILLTLRTIKKYHHKRLPLLFSTWLSKVNKSNVFLMTDQRDLTWQRKVWREGMAFLDFFDSCCSLL